MPSRAVVSISIPTFKVGTNLTATITFWRALILNSVMSERQPPRRPPAEKSLCTSMDGTTSDTECVQRGRTPSNTPLSSQRSTPTPTLIRDLTTGMKNWRIIAKVRDKARRQYEGKDGGPDGEYMYVTLFDDQVSKAKLG